MTSVNAIILSTHDYAGRIEDALMLEGKFEYSFIKPPKLISLFCSTIPVIDIPDRGMLKTFFRNIGDHTIFIIVEEVYMVRVNELLEEFAEEDHNFKPITVTDFIQLTKMKLL